MKGRVCGGCEQRRQIVADVDPRFRKGMVIRRFECNEAVGGGFGRTVSPQELSSEIETDFPDDALPGNEYGSN